MRGRGAAAVRARICRWAGKRSTRSRRRSGRRRPSSSLRAPASRRRAGSPPSATRWRGSGKVRPDGARHARGVRETSACRVALVRRTAPAMRLVPSESRSRGAGGNGTADRGAGGRFALLTQNVDGLHQAAGSRRVVELHGSIRRWRCLRCVEREEREGAFNRYPPGANAEGAAPRWSGSASGCRRRRSRRQIQRFAPATSSSPWGRAPSSSPRQASGSARARGIKRSRSTGIRRRRRMRSTGPSAADRARCSRRSFQQWGQVLIYYSSPAI